MIRIDCPFCGLRDHSEFSYGGDGLVEYPPLEASTEQWLEDGRHGNTCLDAGCGFAYNAIPRLMKSVQ